MVGIFKVDLLAKVEETYQAHISEPKDVQVKYLVQYFNEIGVPIETAVDYCIARIESRNNRNNQHASTAFGLAYPAIILAISITLALVQVFNPINVIWLAIPSALVSGIMIGTYIVLEKRHSDNELIERLYDIKEKLLISSTDKQ